MTPLVLVLATLAVFRAAWMVVREEGPFAVFVFVREHIDPNQKSWIGRGLNCFDCISVWLALVAALLIGGDWLLNWFALAGGAFLIKTMIINKAMLK